MDFFSPLNHVWKKMYHANVQCPAKKKMIIFIFETEKNFPPQGNNDPWRKKREKKNRKRRRKGTHVGSFSVITVWKPHPAKIRATLGGFTGREKIALFLDTTENLYVGSNIYNWCRFWLTPVIYTCCRYQVLDKDGARPLAANPRQPEESARKNAREEGDDTEGDWGGRGRSRSLEYFLGSMNSLF